MQLHEKITLTNKSFFFTFFFFLKATYLDHLTEAKTYISNSERHNKERKTLCSAEGDQQNCLRKDAQMQGRLYIKNA